MRRFVRDHSLSIVTLGLFLFLAVGALVDLGVFLRQKGHRNRRPVHAPHHETGSD